MFVVFFFFSLSTNQREKQGEIFIPGEKMCPLKGESANCLSAFQSVIYESLTSDSPGKGNSSVNQSFPLISVSVNQRVDCKHFALMIGDRDNTLPFCSKDLFVFFDKVCSIFRVIYYPSLLVELFCLNHVVVNERINQLFFISSWLSRFVLLTFSKPFRKYKQKITTIP